MTRVQNKYCSLLCETSRVKTLEASTPQKTLLRIKMSESAINFALEVATSCFDFIIPSQDRARINRKLEEVANRMGISLNTLKTFVGFALIAVGGYLVVLNLFFFILPLAFLFLLVVFLAVMDLLYFLMADLGDH